MENFTPTYLKELRSIRQTTFDEKLVEWVEGQILEANSEDRCYVNIPLRLNSPWEMLVEHFRSLGFYVGSMGYTRKQYDEDGCQVYWFTFGWSIEEAE